jgi:iron complex transport system substrate-binding protein
VDDRGKTVCLPAPPSRIVSLAPSVTEILFAIGAGSRVVAVTSYCDYPRRATRLPKVGDYSTSVERVVAQRPDIVVAGAAANRTAIRGLERIGSLRGKVFAIEPTNLRELYGAITRVGAVTGCGGGAAAVVARMRRAIDGARASFAKGARRPSVVFLVQLDPLWVAGSGTFMDDMILAAGGRNLGAQVGRGFRALALERLIALDPEVILSTHATVTALRSRAGWSTVSAVRRRRVHVLGYAAVRPGPRLADAVAAIVRLLRRPP